MPTISFCLIPGRNASCFLFRLVFSARCTPYFLVGFHRPGRYCVQQQRKVSGRGVGSFLAIPVWCGVFGHKAGLSSGLLLLLMCYSSRNMQTRQRPSTGNVTDRRLRRMANGEYSIDTSLSFLSVDLGAAMLVRSYS